MGQLSPLIWQLSRPSAITLILPHSCLLTGIALRAWAVHTPSISWAPISWAALCAWTYIHTIIQAVHTPPSSWVPISWAAPRVRGPSTLRPFHGRPSHGLHFVRGHTYTRSYRPSTLRPVHGCPFHGLHLVRGLSYMIITCQIRLPSTP